ncbi:MAG: hypothetical protein JWM98_991 [Thermoleophilia bacterium]|nr:hypothetical protein [Thermoleophilia bacterium]
MTVHAHPIDAADLTRMISGGQASLGALTQRVAETRGDLSFDLFQMADSELLDAIESSQPGRRFDVLADARLPGGGMADRVAHLSDGRGGSLATYGNGEPSLFQHAKNYHFSTPAGTESWLTNLAPIPDNALRTELSLVLGGDAAIAAHAVSSATREGVPAATSGAIDAAAGHGILVNDPLAARSTLTTGIHDLLAGPRTRDLLVVTKGIEHAPSTQAIVDAHARGRDVRVFVRDIAEADARMLVDAGVPAWQVSSGLKPRVNAFFAGDRGVVSTAFLWGNMVGGPGRATSRDTGVLLAGDHGRHVRDAAQATVDAMPGRTPLSKLVGRGLLPEHV